MAKFTVSISEDMRQRILALPRGVKFPAFMREAIEVFIEELEKDPDLGPGDFTIARAARNDG
jgi:predicted DNA-binding protein